MKLITLSLTVHLLSLAAASAAVSDDQVITRSFPLAAGTAPPEIVVRVVTGSIRVTTHTAAEVSLTAKAHLESPDAARLADLKNRIRLESEQAGSNIWIGVESKEGSWPPGNRRELGWRNKANTASGNRKDGGDQDRFRHDIELRVPRNAHLKLRTVNGGGIEVEGVEGEFDFNNVNGGITARRVAGFGRAHTVNGPIELGFAALPAGPLTMKTVNGGVRLSAPRNLDATLRLKTKNGKITSGFPMILGASTGRNDSPPPIERGMKRIWTANAMSPARIGNGTGPAIDISTLNGDIDFVAN